MVLGSEREHLCGVCCRRRDVSDSPRSNKRAPRDRRESSRTHFRFHGVPGVQCASHCSIAIDAEEGGRDQPSGRSREQSREQRNRRAAEESWPRPQGHRVVSDTPCVMTGSPCEIGKAVSGWLGLDARCFSWEVLWMTAPGATRRASTPYRARDRVSCAHELAPMVGRG